eukprot:tig00021126_g18465.t1
MDTARRAAAEVADTFRAVLEKGMKREGAPQGARRALTLEHAPAGALERAVEELCGELEEREAELRTAAQLGQALLANFHALAAEKERLAAERQRGAEEADGLRQALDRIKGEKAELQSRMHLLEFAKENEAGAWRSRSEKAAAALREADLAIAKARPRPPALPARLARIPPRPGLAQLTGEREAAAAEAAALKRQLQAQTCGRAAREAYRHLAEDFDELLQSARAGAVGPAPDPDATARLERALAEAEELRGEVERAREEQEALRRELAGDSGRARLQALLDRRDAEVEQLRRRLRELEAPGAKAGAGAGAASQQALVPRLRLGELAPSNCKAAPPPVSPAGPAAWALAPASGRGGAGEASSAESGAGAAASTARTLETAASSRTPRATGGATGRHARRPALGPDSFRAPLLEAPALGLAGGAAGRSPTREERAWGAAAGAWREEEGAARLSSGSAASSEGEGPAPPPRPPPSRLSRGPSRRIAPRAAAAAPDPPPRPPAGRGPAASAASRLAARGPACARVAGGAAGKLLAPACACACGEGPAGLEEAARAWAPPPPPSRPGPGAPRAARRPLLDDGPGVPAPPRAAPGRSGSAGAACLAFACTAAAAALAAAASACFPQAQPRKTRPGPAA